MEIEQWRTDVNHHLETLDMMINDRKTLKNLIESHLKLCFEWDEIEYNKDFSVITMKWNYPNSPTIRASSISDLGMDFIVRADYDSNANRIVAIDVYPWGVDNSP